MEHHKLYNSVTINGTNLFIQEVQEKIQKDVSRMEDILFSHSGVTNTVFTSNLSFKKLQRRIFMMNCWRSLLIKL